MHGVPEEDWPRTVRVLRLAGLPAVACGPGVASALEQHGLSPMATVPNAVGPAPPPADCAELGLDSGTRLVLAVGRLVALKNHALAIAALTGSWVDGSTSDVTDSSVADVNDGSLDELDAFVGEVMSELGARAE